MNSQKKSKPKSAETQARIEEESRVKKMLARVIGDQSPFDPLDSMDFLKPGGAFGEGIAVLGRTTAPKQGSRSGHDRKGDPSLINGKDRVTFRTAEQYLGISERQRQNLVKSGKLDVEGQGHNRKITAESLRKYFPPENPK